MKWGNVFAGSRFRFEKTLHSEFYKYHLGKKKSASKMGEVENRHG